MRRTKIICTVGPVSESAEMLRKLVEAGTDVFRLNFSHGTVTGHQTVMRRIRAVAEEIGKPVAILQDLPGPKIRLGVFKNGSVELHAGDPFCLTAEEVAGDHKHASVSYSKLPEEVRPGQSILLADGTVELEVESAAPREIVCRVVHGGVITSHKGVNVVGGTSSLPAFTERDQKLLLCGIEAGVDLVALSFVRASVDIQSARSFLAAHQAKLPLMAKIEKLESLETIDEILAVADSIMVARGDLGIEVPIAQVPHIQKELISKAIQAAKPVVTATQMLHSMVENPRPSRAEVSDIANAVLDGSDALMLSEESAVGAYPVEAVKVLAETAEVAERRLFAQRPLTSLSRASSVSISEAIAQAASLVALQAKATAIICCTRTGQTARLVAKYRPVQPVLAFSPEAQTVRQLMLVWGVQPILSEEFTSIDTMIEAALELTYKNGVITPGDKVVIVAGAPAASQGQTDFLRVASFEPTSVTHLADPHQ
ncbi:MAG: pyruvate kinase [Candidatus Binatia bacterium]